jgi:trigger factor
MSTSTPTPPTKTDSVTAPDAMATKLPQTVEIRDVGPCKKHVKVTVAREAIDTRFDEKFSDLVLSDQSTVNGFRPKKAPRKIIERRYKKEVASEIKTELLMASLEQLAEEQAISPLSPPELDPGRIFIPDAGPFIYEFDIEVRPEFELPSYKGLKLRKPTHTFTDADVAKEQRKLLEPFGQIVPKDGDDPAVAVDDLITADVTISKDGKELNQLKEIRVKVEPKLALADGVAEDFGTRLTGAKAGDSRTVDITLSQDIANPALRGGKVQAAFKVLDVKVVKQPELTDEMLGYFEVASAEQLGELIRVRLDRQLEYAQRQALRSQVLEQLSATNKLELPQDLLRRQARKTMARRVMEMRSSGMSDEQIAGRQRMLENDALRSTAAALKEHFVLQKIAEIEKLEIEDEDIDAEIEAIADRSGESYRKVKARMEKEDLIEALATELLERKALDLVFETATYDEYEMNPSEDAAKDAVANLPAEVVTEADKAAPPEDAPAAS